MVHMKDVSQGFCGGKNDCYLCVCRKYKSKYLHSCYKGTVQYLAHTHRFGTARCFGFTANWYLITGHQYSLAITIQDFGLALNDKINAKTHDGHREKIEMRQYDKCVFAQEERLGFALYLLASFCSNYVIPNYDSH